MCENVDKLLNLQNQKSGDSLSTCYSLSDVQNSKNKIQMNV